MADETRVWLAQCQCPQRHCILAASGAADDGSEARWTILAPLRERVLHMISAKTLNPWCAICHSPAAKWQYAVGRTRFKTMEEAEPFLRQCEAEQIATNALLGDNMPRND